MMQPLGVVNFSRTKRYLLGIAVGTSLSFLVACGSNDGSATVASMPSIAANTSISAGNTPLLNSLSALYPNGQIPADQSETAAIQRLQSLSNAQIAEGTSNNLADMQSVTTWVAGTETPTNFQTTAVVKPQATTTGVFSPISRVQNTSLYGSYFFTIYPTERSTALASNPNWNYEGPAFSASLTSGTDLFPVHRFRNLQNGSYLYTIYEAERASVVASFSSTFLYEGVAWYARQTADPAWKPLYRFRNVTNGTYLFSAYESEKNAIIANYPTIFALEGIAYYVKEPDAVDKYAGSWTQCTAYSSTAATDPKYVTFNLNYSKTSSTSLSMVAKYLAGYSDSLCKTQTHTNSSSSAAFTATVTNTGTKLASLKTVDKMYTVLSTGTVLGDIYYADGNKLYTGGGTTDASGYFNLLATAPYYLN
jgi:hypothetical protein